MMRSIRRLVQSMKQRVKLRASLAAARWCAVLALAALAGCAAVAALNPKVIGPSTYHSPQWGSCFVVGVSAGTPVVGDIDAGVVTVTAHGCVRRGPPDTDAAVPLAVDP